MIAHYLLSIPILTIACLLLSLTKVKKRVYYVLCIVLLIILNIPLYNALLATTKRASWHFAAFDTPLYNALNLNDLAFGFIGNLSFFSLVFCTLLLLEILQFGKKKIFFISSKGYVYVALSSLFFFLCFLNVIPLNLYYLPQDISLILACVFILCAFFFDKILALIYLFCLFAYTLRLFDLNNIFDYLFDIPSFLVALFASGKWLFGLKK